MKEVSYSCWCCKDNAIIAGYVLHRYGIVQDLMSILPSSAPHLCQRSQCSANILTVTNKDGKDIDVPRYTDHAVYRDISPEVCQWLHEQEFKDAQEKAREADEADRVRRDILDKLNKRLSMPQVPLEPPIKERWKNDPILSKELPPEPPSPESEDEPF